MKDTLKVIKQVDELRDMRGNIFKAIQILEKQAKQVKEDPFLSYDYPMILKKLAILYLDVGQIEKSKKHFKEALKSAKRDLNKIETADIRGYLAYLELETGSIEKALEYVLKAWEYIGTKRGDKFTKTKVNTAIVLGNIYFEQGEYEEAKKKYDVALRNAEIINYTEGLANVLADLANYHAVVENSLDRAEIILEREMDRIKESCKRALPRVQSQLSKVYLKKGKRKEARETAIEAYKFAKRRRLLRELADISELLGRIYVDIDQAKADSYFKEAFDAYNEGGYNIPTEHPKRKDWFTDFEVA
jgi:tetratricopeptide (TPR) repeat protein